MPLPRAGTVVTLALLCAACDVESWSRARPIEPTATTAECARCHGYPPPPFLAGGTAHPASTDCSSCHPATVEADDVTLVPGGAHLDGIVEAVGGHAAGYSDPAIHGPDALASFRGSGLQCSACHGLAFDGGSAGVSCNACHAAAAPAPGFADWTTNCTFCHGARTPGWTAANLALAAPPEGVLGETDASSPRVGAHARHLAGGSYSRAFTCGTCHAVPADLAHVDGAIPVTPSGAGQRSLPASLGSYEPAAQTCAVYCHGSTITPLAPEPQWTAAGPLACDACHGLPPSSGPTLNGASAHAFHVGKGATCATCHAGYGPATVDLTTHVNGVRDVMVAGGTRIAGWDCGGCHAATGAPGMHATPYLAQHTAAALAGLAGCTPCHGADFAGGLDGAAPSCTGCHASQVAASAPDWRANCTFCHGTRTAAVTTATALAAPPQAVANGGDQTSANPKVGAHQAHLVGGAYADGFACGTCHPVPAAGEALTHFTGGTAAVSFGGVAAQGVSSPGYAAGSCAVYCHGSGTAFANPAGTVSPAWTAPSVGCGDCHGVPPGSGPVIEGTSAHAFHVAKGATCASCHAGYSGGVNRALHVNGVKDVVVAGGTRIAGWDCGGCHTATGAPGMHAMPYLAQHTGAALAGLGSCTSCHGTDFSGGLGGLAPSCNGCHASAVAAGAPDWRTNCTFCHGTRTAAVTTATALAAPPQAVASGGDQTSANPKVGAHQAHLAAGAYSNGFACDACHPVPGAAQALTHFTGGAATIAFGALASQGVSSPAYAGSCAVYCHGSGSALANPPATVSPAWTATSVSCGDCHGLPPESGPTLEGTSAHAFHLGKGASCASCHGDYAAGLNRSVHVNGVKDVVVAGGTRIDGWDCAACHNATGAPGMHAVPYPTHGPAALAGAGTCTGCHGGDFSGGLGGLAPSCNACHASQVPPSAPDWRANCTFCHGTRTAGVTTATAVAAPPQAVASGGDQTTANPKVGAHQAHVVAGAYARAFACTTCHPVPSPAEALTHFAGTGAPAEIAFDALATQGVGAPAYSGSGGSCAVYCHGSGSALANPPGTESPAWTATSVACGDCHGLPPSTGPTYLAPNAHAYHLAAGATCGSCHAGYTATGVNVALHVNGAKDVAANGTPIAGWDCAACHDAIGVPPATHPVPYPTHGADALTGLSGCKGCHGDDYAGGLGGLAPSCNGCHAAQVAASAPDWRSNCTFCHGTRTAGVTTATALSAPPQSVSGAGDQTRANPRIGAHGAHLVAGPYAAALACGSCHAVPTSAESLTHFTGGAATVAFDAVASKGVASPAYTGGSCVVYCHGSGTAFPSNIGTDVRPPWTSTALACAACHGNPPITGRHGIHTDPARGGYDCNVCHPGSSAVAPNIALHVDGTTNVVPAGGSWNPATRNCTTVCHGTPKGW